MNRKRGYRRDPRNSHPAFLPSTYIDDFSVIQPGTPVVLWCRVSSIEQNAKKNNEDQAAVLTEAVEAQGGIVVGTRFFIGRTSNASEDLYKASQFAESLGAVLLAESTSRFVRHPNYLPNERPHLTPHVNDLRDLKWMCGDVKLVTLHDPDISWQEERSIQTRRGQKLKNEKGGRPKKRKPGDLKARKKNAIPKIIWMIRVGMGYREIGRALGIAESNIRRWAAPFLKPIERSESC